MTVAELHKQLSLLIEQGHADTRVIANISFVSPWDLKKGEEVGDFCIEKLNWLTQIAVGSLHMFSLPRGYSDGFIGWCKQVIAICFTTFMQTTLMLMGLMTMRTHQLLGLGVMLAANEVPRIAQQFGLDTSMKVNAMGAVHTTTSIINIGRSIAKK